MAKITLDNLAHSYLPKATSEDDFALKELNHVWADGEAYALLGSSGVGKTTLLNLIAGISVPDRGSVTLGDQDVAELGDSARRAWCAAVFFCSSQFSLINFPPVGA